MQKKVYQKISWDYPFKGGMYSTETVPKKKDSMIKNEEPYSHPSGPTRGQKAEEGGILTLVGHHLQDWSQLFLGAQAAHLATPVQQDLPILNSNEQSVNPE